jgi:hypothetical protein
MTLFPPDVHSSTQAADSFVTLMINSKAIFESFAYTHFLRRNFLQPSANHQRLAMDLYRKNMDTIKETIQDPVKAIDNENIITVWTLSLHSPLIESETEGKEQEGRRPSQGPLNSLQLVNFTNKTMRFSSIHRQGLLKLLELRGGVQSLDLGPGAYAFSL